MEVSTCSGCKIVDTVKLGLTDVGPPLQSKSQSAILQRPEANAVFHCMTVRHWPASRPG
jgi:hypothetical protein